MFEFMFTKNAMLSTNLRRLLI